MENEINDLTVQNTISNEEIKNLIFTIRGKQVMLDSDVAMLYHYETKNINKAVKRNIERFPEEFCFQLTDEEVKILRFQIGTSKDNTILKEPRGGRRYLPYVFTEQGIAMLAGILKNEIAVAVSINIIKSFIEMRKFLNLNGQVFERLTNVEYKLLEHDKKFDKEYPILKVVKSNKFHDRFIIIDNKELYHCGASIKDLGKKCFAINKIEDISFIDKLVNE